MSYWERAKRVIPGGVNSPVRAFKGVGGEPFFVGSAKGPYLFDTDGKAYIDYVGSWGPLILGHAHPVVLASVHEAVEKGLSYGAPTVAEIELAEKIISIVPSIEKLRLVSSGTEATMTALRLARAHTGRIKVLKFDGCYHGHHDALLVEAGSGVATLGIAGSAGVPKQFVEETATLPYNDLSALEDFFLHHGEQLAAVIVEPIAGNMNFVRPSLSFIKRIIELCQQYACVSIFDEVMTGFRVALGGAQSIYGVKPDLSTFGKIIGGGLAVGAVGGRSDIMNRLAPLGDTYQAGTLSGNPIAVAAGLATLNFLSKDQDSYKRLTLITKQLLDGLSALAQDKQIPLLTDHEGSMFGLHFTSDKLPQNYSEAKRSNLRQFQQFFHAMLARGVYFAPSMYEAGFVSLAHDQATIEQTLHAAEEAFNEMRQGAAD